MVSRVTFLEIFSSTVCIFCAILNNVIRHVHKYDCAPRGFVSRWATETSFTPALHVTGNYSCGLWPSKLNNLILVFVFWSKRSQKMLTNTYWYHSRWVTSSHQKNSRTLLSPYKMRSLLRLTTRLAHSFGKLSFATPHLTPLEAPRKLSNPRARNKKNASVYVLPIAVLHITICWGNHSNQTPDTISLIAKRH